ncbi:SpaA isopeptide-forming pilin-related protein, partial [Vagococcus lutrae]|uniref:SpaA isopeptide-forming pilin-related protein n=1 Tax=Vagococcus lutrae TaxID=81947 RepID=UPI002A814614
VGQIVTDSTGHGLLSDLDFGEYTLIETKAPEGYQLDATPHVVQVVEEEESNRVTIEIANTHLAPPVEPEPAPESKPQINHPSKINNKKEKPGVLPQTNERNKNMIYIISGLTLTGIVVYSFKYKNKKQHMK